MKLTIVELRRKLITEHYKFRSEIDVIRYKKPLAKIIPRREAAVRQIKPLLIYSVEQFASNTTAIINQLRTTKSVTPIGLKRQCDRDYIAVVIPELLQERRIPEVSNGRRYTRFQPRRKSGTGNIQAKYQWTQPRPVHRATDNDVRQ